MIHLSPLDVIKENKNEMITKDPDRQETLESEFEGENEGKDVDTSDTDNLGESPNDCEKTEDTKENSSMNGILGWRQSGQNDTNISQHLQETSRRCSVLLPRAWWRKTGRSLLRRVSLSCWC